MLDWFTTIPGILIICGVILLIIAIVLFISGSRKSKKEENNITNESTVSSTVDSTLVDTTVSTPSIEHSKIVTVENEVPFTTQNEIPVVDTAYSTPSTTMENPVPVQEPKVEIESNNFAILEPAIKTPVMDTSTTSEISNNEINPIAYEANTPIVDFNFTEKPVTIYGGNDPLDATQTLPKMEVHHEPYGGFYSEARVVEPNVSMDIPTPVEEVITAMPTTESEQPSVIEIPSSESISFDSTRFNEPVSGIANTVETAPIDSVSTQVPMTEEKSGIEEL